MRTLLYILHSSEYIFITYLISIKLNLRTFFNIMYRSSALNANTRDYLKAFMAYGDYRELGYKSTNIHGGKNHPIWQGNGRRRFRTMIVQLFFSCLKDYGKTWNRLTANDLNEERLLLFIMLFIPWHFFVHKTVFSGKKHVLSNIVRVTYLAFSKVKAVGRNNYFLNIKWNPKFNK